MPPQPQSRHFSLHQHPLQAFLSPPPPAVKEFQRYDCHPVGTKAHTPAEADLHPGQQNGSQPLQYTPPPLRGFSAWLLQHQSQFKTPHSPTARGPTRHHASLAAPHPGDTARTPHHHRGFTLHKRHFNSPAHSPPALAGLHPYLENCGFSNKATPCTSGSSP